MKCCAICGTTKKGKGRGWCPSSSLSSGREDENGKKAGIVVALLSVARVRPIAAESGRGRSPRAPR